MNRKPNAKGKRMAKLERLAKIQAAREQAEKDLAARAVDIAHRIGTEADAKLLKILQSNGVVEMTMRKRGRTNTADSIVPPQVIAAIRLGLQRSGRLIERTEVTNIDRPLRDKTDKELLAELGEQGDGAPQ